MALFLVGTPIGNLEDVTLRALRVLKEVRLIAAEDTRTTRKLLHHFEIRTPLISYFEHSNLARLEQILRTAMDSDVALVSEAGMPGLSDPGFEIVKAALDRGIRVIPVPGASAPVAALVASGQPSDRFLFLGFLPRRTNDRRKLLSSVAREPYTLVLFEAPHRILASLADMARLLGNRRLAVARELTKVYEEIYRGTIDEAIQHFCEPRGEFTLVVEGHLEAPALASENDIQGALERAMTEGLSSKDAIARVIKETGWSKRNVYRVLLSST
ncbi:MAG: 16S rRNA (cytidine(1402)-2'-O)-methyltransferase [Dehalococcoidia bacterium]|nr:16S rRNA (cytidine(1402)-2'-O)-methyltransferase [Dehalococcoidia bacterium]